VIRVGHSYGGPLITLFAKAHPDRVVGLVYADTPDLEHVFGPQYQGLTRRIHLP
jgi:pimeloyl-ACP methyl ester carboxylesterase